MTYALVFLAAYLIGSIPFGLILTKLAGLGDIRAIGSGNIGATNVLRTGNKKLAALTLLLDGAKGFVATKGIYIAHITLVFYVNNSAMRHVLDSPLTHSEDIFRYKGIAAVGAVIGHIFPVWLKFKGGKGVATAIGALLGLHMIGGLSACLFWLVAAFAFGYSSLAAIIGLTVAWLLSIRIYLLAVNGYLFNEPDIEMLHKLFLPIPVSVSVIVLLVIYRHKDNIKRLLNGTEPKIGKKTPPLPNPPPQAGEGTP